MEQQPTQLRHLNGQSYDEPVRLHNSVAFKLVRTGECASPTVLSLYLCLLSGKWVKWEVRIRCGRAGEAWSEV